MKKKALLVSIVLMGTGLLAADGASVYKSKCHSCHGDNAAKPALNKSQVIAGWDASKIIESINLYKNGGGGAMKGVMKPIATALSEDDLKAVAATISAYK